YFFVLIDYLVTLKAGEPLEFHIQYGLSLKLRKRKPLHEPVFRLEGILGGANERDDVIQVLDGDLQAFQDMCAGFRLAQLEDRPSNHHVPAVLNEGPEHVTQIEYLGLTVMNGKKADPVTFLKLGEF